MLFRSKNVFPPPQPRSARRSAVARAVCFKIVWNKTSDTLLMKCSPLPVPAGFLWADAEGLFFLKERPFTHTP